MPKVLQSGSGESHFHLIHNLCMLISAEPVGEGFVANFKVGKMTLVQSLWQTSLLITLTMPDRSCRGQQQITHRELLERLEVRRIH